MFKHSLLLKYAIKHPILILLTIILGFSGAIFNGIGTTLIVPLLLAFLGQQTALFKDTPPLIQKALNLFSGLNERERLLCLFGTILLAIILKNMANYGNSLVSSRLSQNLVSDIRLESLRIALEVDLDFYAKQKTGHILNIINDEVARVASGIRALINLSTTVITISVFVWLLIYLSWQLTIFSVFLLGLVALINQFFIRASRHFGKVLSLKSRDYSNKLFEILTGIRLIKTVSNEAQEYNKIAQLIRDREKAEFQFQSIAALMGPFNEVSGIITVLLMVVVGRYLFAVQVRYFAPILLTYLIVLFRLLPLINQLNTTRSQLANLSYGIEIATDFLQRDNKPFLVNGKIAFPGLQEYICFDNIYFAYPDHQDMVLKGISLTIPKGKMVALVGASGAGKSTIADLLPRFYDPTQGRILIDGLDLREYDIRSLRQKMGVVSQDTFLFNNTVFYNIAYGLDNVSEAEVIKAAKRANAYEFILNLPKGFDTELGDRGVLLSGGQKQRMAIARALLRDPEILILDEATSALDTVSEQLVQEAINELSQSKTSLVIAHRLSTIHRADQIAVLDQGKIVELGTHEQLMEKAGYYQRLYLMQFKHQSQAQTSLR